MTDDPEIQTIQPDGYVWRVGYKDNPWVWVGWEWADNGKFDGRWDDINGNFRTVYAGTTLQSCLIEMPATFRAEISEVFSLLGLEWET
ncbi:hypothetical protein [Arthrobacter castelli]|uniref:hypothetical protein n=1 Tax=Arthrobacter castelli TaxID=271431 RepID=UPI00041B9017|nr:hypothetical protein [Arthrobacter castelli]